MFTAIGRRLALLNAVVFVAVLIVVGVSIYLFLDRRIINEVDHELRTRTSAAAQLWSPTFTQAATGGATAPTSSSGQSSASVIDSDSKSKDDKHDDDDDDDDHHDDDYSQEVIRSGETIAYGFDATGLLLADLRQIDVDGLPANDLVRRALAGEKTKETRRIDGQSIRLRTEPVLIDGKIAGVLQVGMGMGPNHEMLRFIRYALIGGLLLGVVIAIPSGVFLANRSMRPIQQTFDQQREFVANAAHELRTPLALVRAQAEYLHSDPEVSADEVRAGEELIISEVDGISRLVSSLLLLARADNSALVLDRQSVDLHQITSVQVARYSGQAEERGLELRLEDSTSVITKVDRIAIEQVLGILMSNAIAYTPSGGRISVRTYQNGRMAILEAKDTGIGIEPADLSRIFDRFYRADPARARASGGEGLGLAIAKTLIEAHGGSISATSRTGHGSTFTIGLPAESRLRSATS